MFLDIRGMRKTYFYNKFSMYIRLKIAGSILMTFCMVILIDPKEFLADCIAQNKYNLLSLTTLKCKQTIALKLVLSFYNNYYYCLLF